MPFPLQNKHQSNEWTAAIKTSI